MGAENITANILKEWNSVENQQLETAFENDYLETTITEVKRQLKQAKEAVSTKEQELIEMKREMREETDHYVTDLYSADGFEALISLSQSMAPVTDLAVDCEEISKKIVCLENIMKCPYFARIDFRFEDEDTAEKIYIGRFSLTKGKAAKIYVYDWRSPIASVFYRFMTGKASYEAPAGTIEGELERKRQYEIKDGKLIYFFDTDMNISDEILKQLLSKNSSPKMKAIVETIQKEQDVVIRNMKNDLLMIQGVAGSGKTSIALHRAAYLVYHGLQNRLSANNILILSPNTAFEQYISNVLPELGEENVVSMVFEDLLHAVLREKSIRSQNEFFETSIGNGPYKRIVKDSMRCKTSEDFLNLLNQFVLLLPANEIEFQDIYYEGNCIAGKEEMRNWILQRPDVPLAVRLEQLEKRILEEVFGNKYHADGEEESLIIQQLHKFTRLNVYQLYENLWKNIAYYYPLNDEEAGKDEKDEKDGIARINGFSRDLDEIHNFLTKLHEIREFTLNDLSFGKLGFDDAVAVLYLHLMLYGSNEYRNIKQVIIDEAQDYYPLQYEIFRMLFTNAKFTVLGDINQTLTKQETISFYDQVRQCLKKEQASLISLDKSFRCTNEILQFGLQFIEHKPEIQSFNRDGDAVTVCSFKNHQEYLERVTQEVKECREKGFETICMICKTEKESRKLYEKLKERMDIRLITADEMEHIKGNLIIPSYMAKGLEFDAVIICDADTKNYCDEDDQKLLYIECTRALHRLSVFCEGEMTKLIDESF